MSTTRPDDVAPAGSAPSSNDVVALAPHHDGSEVYVPGGTPSLEDVVPVRVRVPRAPGGEDAQVRAVWLRTVRDGEPRLSEARLEREDEHESWYVADVLVHNPVTSLPVLPGRPGRVPVAQRARGLRP